MLFHDRHKPLRRHQRGSPARVRELLNIYVRRKSEQQLKYVTGAPTNAAGSSDENDEANGSTGPFGADFFSAD